MFFTLSKILGFLRFPSHLLVALAASACPAVDAPCPVGRRVREPLPP